MTTWSDGDLLLAEADDEDVLSSIERNEASALASESALRAWLNMTGAGIGTDSIESAYLDLIRGKELSAAELDATHEKKNKAKVEEYSEGRVLQLREAVKELEIKLAQMKKSGTVCGTTESAMATTATMWQRIAERQLKQRERSLTENARLRALVDEHLSTTKRLERLIMKGCTSSQELMWLPEEHLATALKSNPLKDSASKLRCD